MEDPHYHGHRERLRARFKEAGEDALADYELLELILFRAIPRKDVKPLAKALLKRFGSFAETLNAREKLLLEVEGMTLGSIFEFKLVLASAKKITKSKVMGKQIIASWMEMLDYCRTLMAFEEREIFHVIYLDKRNGVIASEIQGVGTVDQTPVYPREVIKRALELSATALILAHNHPSGDPAPSNADVLLTLQIQDIAKPLGIVLHDHIIIGKQGHASLKGLKLF